MEQIYNLVIIFFTVFFTFILSGNFLISKIKMLQKLGQPNRVEIESHIKKQGTPTMGGIIVFLSVLIFSIVFCKIKYIIHFLFIIVGFFLIGLYDDLIKIIKKNHLGVPGSKRLTLGAIVSVIFIVALYYNYPAFLNENARSLFFENKFIHLNLIDLLMNGERNIFGINLYFGFLFIPVMVFIILGVANSTNITDGLDGLVSIPTLHSFVFLIIAAVGTYFLYFKYNIMLSIIQNFGTNNNCMLDKLVQLFYVNNLLKYNINESYIYLFELIKLVIIFFASILGFLWFNCKPAKIFLGDCGSLMIGAFIAALAIALQVELFLPIICFIFVIETLSVIIQVLYFKITKGKRIFKMAPLHHHFEKSNMQEEQITIRFWIISFCALLAGTCLYLLDYFSYLL